MQMLSTLLFLSGTLLLFINSEIYNLIIAFQVTIFFIIFAHRKIELKYYIIDFRINRG